MILAKTRFLKKFWQKYQIKKVNSMNSKILNVSFNEDFSKKTYNNQIKKKNWTFWSIYFVGQITKYKKNIKKSYYIQHNKFNV